MTSPLRQQLGAFSAPESMLDDDGNLLPSAKNVPLPTAQAMQRAVAAYGEEALLSSAILYQADWRKLEDGLGRHAREQATALSAAGMPVILRAISAVGGLLDADAGPEVMAAVGHLARSGASEVPISIRQLILHGADYVKGIIAPPAARLSGFDLEKRVYESTIIYTSLERDRIHPDLVKVLNRCAAAWVPCDSNRNALVSSGVREDKVFVVPYPYDPAKGASTIAAPRGSEVMVPNGKRFYTIGKWEPRKAHHTLIGAFLREFSPREHASLYIKTSDFGGNWENYPTIAQSYRHWADDPAVKAKGWTERIIEKLVRCDTRPLWDDRPRYTREQFEDPKFQKALAQVPRFAEPATMIELHRRNNIYVSASHGEAWEIGAFDAKCAGNALVHVGYGGTEMYASPNDVAVEWGMGSVHPGYRWEADAQWAEYRIEDLSAALRAAKPPTSRVHPPGFWDRFGKRSVGHLMVSILEKVCTEESWQKLCSAGSFG